MLGKFPVMPRRSTQDGENSQTALHQDKCDVNSLSSFAKPDRQGCIKQALWEQCRNSATTAPVWPPPLLALASTRQPDTFQGHASTYLTKVSLGRICQWEETGQRMEGGGMHRGCPIKQPIGEHTARRKQLALCCSCQLELDPSFTYLSGLERGAASFVSRFLPFS